ncbi:uncharacterized protein THITE_2036988, partial [Thermothielavioides terrestris NRRL 8126]
FDLNIFYILGKLNVVLDAFTFKLVISDKFKAKLAVVYPNDYRYNKIIRNLYNIEE